MYEKIVRNMILTLMNLLCAVLLCCVEMKCLGKYHVNK